MVIASKLYRNFFIQKSIRKFANREEVFEFLEHEVFLKSEFIANVSETARTKKVSYLLAYDLITNYLTDILYEVDKGIEYAKQKRKVKINVFSYFSLQIGFMVSTKGKKMFLEKFIKI